MKRLLVLALTLTGAASGCGDKTTQDYQQELVNERLGQIQPYAGTYAGGLTSTTDGKSLGSVLITLTPDTVAQQSRDGTGTEQSAVFKGSITTTLTGNTPSTLTFSLGAYDVPSHVFDTDVTVNDQSGKSHSVNIHGTISQSGQFVGNLNADDFDSYQATFSASKNATISNSNIPSMNYSSRGKTWAVNSTTDTYTGTLVDVNNGTRSASITLNPNYTDSSQAILNVLIPRHMISANLSIIGVATIVFPAASTTLDDQVGTLSGTSTVVGASTGSVTSYQENLNCTFSNGNQDLSCDLIGSLGTSKLKLQLAPQKN
jgi:hypothetical protein